MSPTLDDRPHVHPPTTRICVRGRWDAALERTERLRPTRCHAALLDWRPERWPDDGGMPVEIALALASALTKLGRVMGRADGRNQAGPLTTLVPAPRRTRSAALRDGLLQRARGEAVVQTRDFAEVAVLLDSGWSVQRQAILVLSLDGSQDVAIDALRYRWDWRDFRFEPPVEVLLVPSNDGDGVVFAAASEAALADVLAEVAQAWNRPVFLASQVMFRCDTSMGIRCCCCSSSTKRPTCAWNYMPCSRAVSRPCGAA